ncbi:MAG: Ig-like domain-containing protein [Dehalococcoidales bacterium]|nr:Ig-like domain-containing protein [Dehalococcoidales bacterium]
MPLIAAGEELIAGLKQDGTAASAGSDIESAKWNLPNNGNPSQVDISVILKGGSRPESGWEVPVTINFFEPEADVMSDAPLCTFNLTTTKDNDNAIAQIESINPETYDVSICSPHCLTNVKRDVVIGETYTGVDMGTLLEGNADDDNKISISDFGILANTYGKQRGDEGFDERADFDRNDKVNIADFGLMATNYGKSSPIDLGSDDREPPAVESTDPEEGETGVLPDASITALFSETLDEDTVNEDTFVLYRDDTRIEGTVSYSSKTAIFDPSGDLSPGILYTATLTTGIEDSHSNALENEYTWSFTTVEAPEVQSVTPEDGTDNISIKSNISAIFSKDLNPDTITNNSFQVKTGSSLVPGEIVYDSSQKMITFTPGTNLGYGYTYTVSITTAVKDIEGVSLENTYTWSFTTSQSLTSVKIGSDTVSTGGSFVIEVSINDVIDLAAYQIRVSFDQSLLEVDEDELYSDPNSIGEVGSVVFPVIAIIQDNGDLFYIAESTENIASGDGYLARIPFKALENTGQSNIEFNNFDNENKLFDYDQIIIPSTWENGTVTVNAP